MQATIIIPVLGVKLEAGYSVSINNFLLTNDGRKKVNFISDPIILKSFGENALSKVFHNPMFIYEGSLYGDFPDLKGITDEYFICDYISEMIHGFLVGLWLVKDNSIGANELFLVSDLGNVVYNAFAVATNCEGKTETITLTNNDVLETVAINHKRSEYYAIQESMEFPVILKDSRLFKALNFLRNYIWNKLPEMKQAFNVMCLECLVSTGGESISQTVSERISLYICNDADDKDKIFNVVKESYDIRSRYVHGGTIKKADAEIIENSKKLDIITRKVLTKIITDRTTNIFMLRDTKGNRNKLNHHFSELAKNYV